MCLIPVIDINIKALKLIGFPSKFSFTKFATNLLVRQTSSIINNVSGLYIQETNSDFNTNLTFYGPSISALPAGHPHWKDSQVQ